jgi:hypothetical protein
VINAPQLLADLTRLLKRFEDDLRQRIADVAELKASLQAEWQAARDADRTAETFESWADQVITQAGVHWLLSCVFLRFIEDNELVGAPMAGRNARVRPPGVGARPARSLLPREAAGERPRLPARLVPRGRCAAGAAHVLRRDAQPRLPPGPEWRRRDGLRQFWQQVDPNTGHLAHDFTDPDWNTRFLGDLYQDLSEATRKRYALLQTPEFVEEFILDRTLTPAIREFGFREVRMIDPTCGSGHFLLGGFRAWSMNGFDTSRHATRATSHNARWTPSLGCGPESVRRRDLALPAAGGGAQGQPVHRLSKRPTSS